MAYGDLWGYNWIVLIFYKSSPGIYGDSVIKLGREISGGLAMDEKINTIKLYPHKSP